MDNKKKRNRSHGAVTIFLTLILVPCLIFTCAFGDVSRVVLSQSQATAVSDLALYSLMANYDESLKEWYGLVASCQTIDSFYETSANYFKGMMDSHGVDGIASQSLVAFLSAAQSGDLTDFLKVEGLDSVKVSAVSDGAMGSNPALIEDGIVEFMKYRGPVVIVEEIIERFKQLDLSGDLDGLKEADENEPVVETKKKYATAEGEMMEDLLHSYLAIKQYVDYRAKNGVPVFSKYHDEYPKMLSLIADDFKNVTDLITKYYAATEGIKDISVSFPAFDCPTKGAVNDDHTAVIFYLEGIRMIYTLTGTEHAMVGPESSIGAKYDFDTGGYYFSNSAMEKITENVEQHITNIQQAAQRVVNACNGITRPPTADDVNQAVYCMRIQNAISTSDLNTIKNSGKALMQILAKLYLAQFWDLPYSVTNTIDRLKNIHRDYLSYTSPNTEYERILNEYKGVASNTVSSVKDRKYLMTSEYLTSKGYATGQVTLETFLRYVHQDLGGLQEHLIRQIGHIDTILNGGTVKFPTEGGKTYDVPSLDQLKVRIKNLCTARENWGEEASRHSTQYAQEEQEEYDNPSQEGEKWVAAIAEEGPESVEILRTRLQNIRADMVALRTVISNFTYGGKEICLLTTEDAIAAGKTVIPTTVNTSASAYISQSLSNNKTAAEQYHPQLISGGSYTPPQYVSGEAGNDPDLDEDRPSIYDLMCRELKTDKLEDAVNKKESQEEKNKADQDEANNQATAAKGKDLKYLGDLGKDPKETSGSDSFGIGTVITGLIGTIQTLLSGNFDEFRDQIYVCAYIMEMFGWSSYDNEGMFKLARADLGNDDLPTLADYDTTNHRFMKTGTDYSKQWADEDPKFTANKSLTNQKLDSKHNRSHLAELEYILYGEKTNDANLGKAYEQIFIIRETLNLISGFQYFYNNAALTAFAGTIMAATCGLIPEAVTKVVIITLMATLESVNDLNRLKAGTPVAVYKNEDQWCLKITEKTLENLTKGDGVQKSDPNGLYYSDYMLMFLVISCQDPDMYETILLRVGDLIEGNTELMLGENKTFDLEKSQVYFQMIGDLRVKPLLMELPLVTNYKGADASKLLESKGWCSYSLNVIRGYS